MNTVCGGISETGLVRRNNEDAILLRTGKDAALFLVADGVGGREHGEVVSAMLRDGFADWWDAWFLPRENHASFPEVIDALREKLTEINTGAVNRFGEMNAGSTLVLLFLYGGNCVRFSSGDSRIYRARGLRLCQLTRDDVYENLAVKPAGYGKEANGKLVAAMRDRRLPWQQTRFIPATGFSCAATAYIVSWRTGNCSLRYVYRANLPYRKH